ncbi:MAG TPA: flagellar hook capping FlgD N-terminal domain-containing protein [Rhizomicrobium sp.]|jgi:flagellar basal-body rod modification protein FlgD|nr:flagellar hook capping FlgD N-terminal domain-containing protein [Rhizomicrobium sp.]
MTTIDTSQTLNGSQSAAANQLAGNFDTFLTLLTTQLQNQDPLSPMDSTQFTQQLVAFSSVEQQINTNDNLKSLIALSLSQQASAAVNYIGHSVVLTNGKGSLNGGTVDWTYNLGAQSTGTILTVTNASGQVVYTTSGETAQGNSDFTWDGKDAGGNQLPDGEYTLSVQAVAADGSAITTTVASKAIVTAVDMSGTTPMLVLGAMEIPLSDVSLVGAI